MGEGAKREKERERKSHDRHQPVGESSGEGVSLSRSLWYERWLNPSCGGVGVVVDIFFL